MLGNAKECRQRAARCAEMAIAAHTPQLRGTFLELSKNWEKLAIQLEDAFAKRTEREAIRSNVRESLELRVTSVLMTADDCRRVRSELAVEYEAVAEQWEAISVLTALLGTK